MVEKRKRMLQKFLNRLAKHEILSYEHVFHRFLEAGVSWVCLSAVRLVGVSPFPMSTLFALKRTCNWTNTFGAPFLLSHCCRILD